MTQTKDLDSHAPSFMNGNGNGVLYEDLAHARPRPPMAPPSIEVSFVLWGKVVNVIVVVTD